MTVSDSSETTSLAEFGSNFLFRIVAPFVLGIVPVDPPDPMEHTKMIVVKHRRARFSCGRAQDSIDIHIVYRENFLGPRRGVYNH